MLAPLLLLALSSLAPVLATRPALTAVEAEVHLLWPSDAPGALGAEPKDRPRLLVTHAARTPAPHAAIVICPGGGYGGLAMDHEGHAIARWASSLGITAAILDYRHRGKGYGHPQPLLDAQRALRYVRDHAAAWNVAPDRIGVLGFSAGGHLASSVSVHHDDGVANAADPIERRSSRPDFAILCYPVIAFGQKHTHLGSQRNLLGPEPTEALVLEMSSERQVTRRTPPTFLWHTSADTIVPVQNSLAFYLALREHEVPCELHVFEQGAHGLGLANGHAASAWPELCRRWLVTRGVLAP
ncbi:MAG: alpha/beta hydrolase [Planctomycetes bacterium]|nr:alpha/beta hydrolase [Planctomycetota bacterium]